MGCGCKKKKQQPVVTQESTNTQTSNQSNPAVEKVEQTKES